MNADRMSIPKRMQTVRPYQNECRPYVHTKSNADRGSQNFEYSPPPTKETVKSAKNWCREKVGGRFLSGWLVPNKGLIPQNEN